MEIRKNIENEIKKYMESLPKSLTTLEKTIRINYYLIDKLISACREIEKLNGKSSQIFYNTINNEEKV